MAEEIVVKESFSDQMMNSGQGLVRELDVAGFDVTAALWLFSVETGGWRLIIASPKIDSEGPKAAYGTVQGAITKLNPSLGLGLDIVSVVSPSDPLIALVRNLVRTPGGGVVRLTRSRLNNIYVEDAVIFRA